MALRHLAAVLAMATATVLAACGGGQADSDSERPPAPASADASAAPLPTYAPWPGALRDPRHTSTAPVSGPTKGKVIWKRELEGSVVPGPAVGGDGTIYAASNGGVLHAFDGDGNQKWSFDGGGSYGLDLSTTPALTRDGTVLWPGPGALYALDPDGKLLWDEPFDSLALSPLLADPKGKRIYVMEMGGALTALERNGEGVRELWRTELGSVSYSSPALGTDGTVYTGADDSLFAIDAEDGEARWEYETGGLIEVSPAVAPDGTIVIGSNDAMAHGVDPDGSERWRLDLGEITYSSPAIGTDGVGYIGDHSGAVKSFDSATGEQLFEYQGMERTEEVVSVGVWTAPLIDKGGRVYFGTRPGKIYGFEPDGKRLFEVETGATVDSYPALTADGTLVIGSEDGFLYAIGD